MNVLYATDESGLWMYELSRAALAKALPDAEVTLLTDFDGESDSARIVNIRPYLEGFGILRLWKDRPYRFPPMSAARLFAPVLPETCRMDRVLYLDTDTLVLDGEAVRRMYGETEFGDGVDCAGARDDAAPLFLASDNRRLTTIREATLESGVLGDRDGALVANMERGLYINTGVVLYNMASLAGEGYRGTLDAAVSVLSRHHFKFFDQDATNALLHTQELPGRFNDLVAGHGMEPYADTAIAHYAGGGAAKEAFEKKAHRLLR